VSLTTPAKWHYFGTGPLRLAAPRFPLRHRRVIRTTNLLERLFLEERRRTKIIPHAFGERPVLKLMYAAVIRAADRRRGIQVGEFEQRQLKALPYLGIVQNQPLRDTECVAVWILRQR
jgi:hypothetical protein